MGNVFEKTNVNRAEYKLEDKKNENLYKSYGGDLNKMFIFLGVQTENLDDINNDVNKFNNINSIKTEAIKNERNKLRNLITEWPNKKKSKNAENEEYNKK